MNKIFKAAKYQLMSYRIQSLSCFTIIVLNIIISLVLGHILSEETLSSGGSAGSTDIIAFMWILVLGIAYFKSSFKFMLSNGVSRKRFFWSSTFSFVIISAIWAVAVTLLVFISRKLSSIAFVLFELLYKGISPLGAAFWLFAALFMLSIIGWLISMIYYRSSTLMKFAVTLAPFVLFGLFTLFNYMNNGALLDAFIKSFLAAMGLSSKVHNSYIGSLSMLVTGVIICCFNFLLIRKAPVKD